MILYFYMGLMIIVSAVWLVWFLLSPLKFDSFNLEHSNVALGKQKQAELQQDLKLDLIDEGVFSAAQDEITQTLAVELIQESQDLNTHKSASVAYPAVFSMVFLLVFSLGLYQFLSPKIQPQNGLATSVEPLSLTQSVDKIREHLLDEPNDAQLWLMLGSRYLQLNNIDESLKAYEKAYQLDGKNPRILVEYASAIATKNDDNFMGRPIELVKQALLIEPNAPGALYLAGLFAIDMQDLDLAKALWERALSKLPSNSTDRPMFIQVLAELAELREENPQEDTKTVAYVVTIKVAFSEQIRLNRANDYMMIYVKAAKGRPMPIAIQKIKLKDFSGQITLTDSDSVMPTRKLSQSNQVIAVARLSQSGSAMRQSGDIQTLSEVLNVSDNPIVSLQFK